MKIPKAFSRDELQVDAEDIANQDKIASWKYLDETLQEISRSSYVEIGLLIGANCSKPLEPNKIIAEMETLGFQNHSWMVCCWPSVKRS